MCETAFSKQLNRNLGLKFSKNVLLLCIVSITLNVPTQYFLSQLSPVWRYARHSNS